jgi:hypothetical protein
MGFEAARYLAEDIGIRFSGTPAEVRAADFVAEQFRSLGYPVEEQPFRFLGWEMTEPAQLTFSSPAMREVPVHPFIWSDATPQEGVEGRVERVGRMDVIGLFEWDKFALIDPKTDEPLGYFGARADGPTVSMAQASAIFTVPLVVVGRDDLALIEGWEAAGQEMRARLKVSARFKPGAVSRNIIATLPGTESEQGIVLCGHYDSQYNTPGGYDNASGMGLVLEVAARLRHESFRRPIYFIGFGAEEYLYVGADYYVMSLKERGQLNRVAAAVNVDSILIPDKRDSLLGGAVVHHTEDAMEIGRRVRAITEEEGLSSIYNITYESPPTFSGDHAPFVREGIPAVKLLDAAPVWFHTPQDTFDRIDQRAWEDSVRCVQRLVQELAASPE